MKTRLIQIGNSRGIRLPKPLIEQCSLGDEVNLEVNDRGILVSPLHLVREGWDEAFRAMHAQGADQLLDSQIPTQWEGEQWEWK